METIDDRLSFEQYIGLKDTCRYNITLLCRLEKDGLKYLFLILNGYSDFKFKRSANLIMRQIRFLARHKKTVMGLSFILFLILINFSDYFFVITGCLVFILMIWYLFILKIQIEIDNHDVLVFDYVNENIKVSGDKCFRLLTKYVKKSKLEFLINLTSENGYRVVDDSGKYIEILNKIIEYTESKCPYFKVIMAFATEKGDDIKLIQYDRAV